MIRRILCAAVALSALLAILAWTAMALGLPVSLLRVANLLLGAAVVVYVFRHSGGPSGQGSRSRWVCLAAFALYLVGLLFISNRLIHRPEGMDDAVTIWNTKARDYCQAYLHGIPFKAVRTDWACPEYPPFQPVLTAALANTLGRWHLAVPHLLCLTCYSLVFWMVFDISASAKARLPLLICLSGISLCPRFPAMAADLCADLPLSMVYAFAFYNLCQALSQSDDTSTWDRGPLRFTFFAILLLPLIKMEGAIMAVSLLAAAVLLLRKRLAVSGIAIFAAGASALVLFLVWFKSASPFAYYRLDSVSLSQYVLHITTANRWVEVLGAGSLFVLKTGGICLLMMILSFAPKREWFLLTTPILCTFLAYNLIFVITPFDQNWHLWSAHMRLCLQLLPAFLLVNLFLLERDPGPVFQASVGAR